MNRPVLAVLIAVGALLVACGGDDDDSDGGTLPSATVGQLVADGAGVEVAGEEVPTGTTREIELGQEISLAKGGRALLDVRDVHFELFMQTTMTVVKADLLDVVVQFALGHVTAALADPTEMRLRLETPTDVVLTARKPGTQLTACHAEGLTCLAVVRGEVEWQAQGQTETYTAGQSSFGDKGDLPNPATCVPPDHFAVWFEDARRNQAGETLGQLVGDSPPCEVTTTTSSSATTGPVVTVPAVQVIVEGNVAWTDTGVDVQAGDLVRIQAIGGVTPGAGRPVDGPDGDPDPALRTSPPNIPELPDTRHAALIGRFTDTGTPFLVGSGAEVRAERDGRLFLGINDLGLENNTGSFVATIEVAPG